MNRRRRRTTRLGGNEVEAASESEARAAIAEWEQEEQQLEKDVARLDRDLEAVGRRPKSLSRSRSPVLQVPLLSHAGSGHGVLCLPDEFRLPDTKTTKGLLIGKGTYGSIVRVCKASDAKDGCSFVAKVQLLDRTNRESAKRDVYFLTWLTEHAHPQISPRIISTALCRHPLVSQQRRSFGSEEPFTMVMDKWDMDCDRLSVLTAAEVRRQAAAAGHSIDNLPLNVLKEEHLEQMFRILVELRKYGIVHADVKPNQFLYSTVRNRIVLTDFGFAGLVNRRDQASPILRLPAAQLTRQDIYHFTPILGWPVTTIDRGTGRRFVGCWRPIDVAQPLDSRHPIVMNGLLPWLDIWELDMYLWMFEFFIWTHAGKLVPYWRVDEDLLPPKVESYFAEICPGAKSITDFRRQDAEARAGQRTLISVDRVLAVMLHY